MIDETHLHPCHIWSHFIQPRRFIMYVKAILQVCLNSKKPAFPARTSSKYLKLYCRYEYTNPCMINCIWGLKTTMTSGESTCLISFTWAQLTCSERGGNEKFKMKIYVSYGIRTHTTPVHDRKVTAP